MVTGLDGDAAGRAKVTHHARTELGMYLAGLIEERRKKPGDDMLSQLSHRAGAGRCHDDDGGPEHRVAPADRRP